MSDIADFLRARYAEQRALARVGETLLWDGEEISVRDAT